MTVRVNINGKHIEVEEKTTILNACQMLNEEIPTLCYLKGLQPDGSCRMCVVEVEGGWKNGMVASCVEYCRDGMTVWTHSEKVIQARKFVLETLLENHDTDCFSCAKNGSCLLQKYCLAYGVEKTIPFVKREGTANADNSNPFFAYNPDKCVLCGKCVRVCETLQGREAIGFFGRGRSTCVSPGLDLPWGDSVCESCGNCVHYCPTGALSSKDNQKSYRAWEVKKVRTTCPHCGTGCQLDLLVKNGKVVGAEPADGPANNGLLCVKGRFGSYKFISAGDRLTHPLVKRNGVFERAEWDEALELIAGKLTEIKSRHGADAIAGFSCSRASNEDNYVFQKMMRAAIGTNNVDNCARLCHSATVHGLAMTLGSGAMTNPIADITEDVDAIMLVGSNPTEAHPVIGARIRRAVQNGAKLIVVDPRKIDLAKDAAIHLRIKPGTNVAFANGLLHILIKEGLADMEYIHSRTEGFEEIVKVSEDYPPEKVAEICGIDADDLRRAAILYATAPKAPIIYCLGVTEHSSGTEGVMSLSNVAMAAGKIGKSGCGINPLRGQNNVQGACDMGCMPSDLPGYQKIANPDMAAKFGQAWGVTLSREPGLTSTQALPAALAGTVKAMYIFGENPMMSDPNTEHVKRCLEALEFLVVQELFMTETAQLADVVLPAACYAEKEGTVTNTERRVQRIRQAVPPPEGTKLDTDIFCEIMTRMGYPCQYEHSADIMQEIASLTPSYAGVSHKRLDAGETLQWPCKDENDKGVYYLHKDGFARGKGMFYPAVYKPAGELPDEEYPLTMTTGRMLYHYNTAAMTGRTEGINEIAGRSYIEINEKDAKAMGIRGGDTVTVSSRRGATEAVAAVGDRVGEGEVFMTFHFADGNANILTNNLLDDIARIPEYKVCAVRVEK